MIATEIQDALNRQINDDYCSWYFYRSAAAYCRETNLRGLGKWLYRRSKKKLDHATRIADFILERRGHVESAPIDSHNGHWDSPRAVLDTALQRERELGESVSKLVNLSMSRGDHATHDFLEGFAADQMEAEAKVESVRDHLEMVGDTPTALYMLDRDLG